MKIRLDFVTNSSSSSFICAFCNKFAQDPSSKWSKWVQCKDCGSVYEVSCALPRMSLHEIRKALLPILREQFHDEAMDFLNYGAAHDPDYYHAKMDKTDEILINILNDGWLENKIKTDKALSQDVESVHAARMQKIKCPICNLDKLHDSAILSILLHKLGKTRKQITADAKKKYGTLKNAQKEINIPKGGLHDYS